MCGTCLEELPSGEAEAKDVLHLRGGDDDGGGRREAHRHGPADEVDQEPWRQPVNRMSCLLLTDYFQHYD